MARLVRSYVVPVMEGVPLGHERDISHSSVEWVCLPNASMVVEHILISTADLVRDLVVDASHMTTVLDGRAKVCGLRWCRGDAHERRDETRVGARARACGLNAWVSLVEFAELIHAAAKDQGVRGR
ncbi:hypothetical protein [Lentzea guizhouensis]|uniref:hypothetical protein n=1 Tax=Lentzea guizhouensis TaxID=1586287 RepID=UPI0012B69A64|nr:hypothetical protein [Lentzea guizhouensis]